MLFCKMFALNLQNDWNLGREESRAFGLLKCKFVKRNSSCQRSRAALLSDRPIARTIADRARSRGMTTRRWRGENLHHLVAQIRDNESPLSVISRAASCLFLVINSPNSLGHNVESSDSARSFLTSLSLAPLSLAQSSRPRICQRASARQFVPFARRIGGGTISFSFSLIARDNFSSRITAALFSVASSNLSRDQKRTLICVLTRKNAVFLNSRRNVCFEKYFLAETQKRKPKCPFFTGCFKLNIMSHVYYKRLRKS